MHTLLAGILALIVLAGDWKVEGGALAGEAPPGNAKRRAYAAALLGPASERPEKVEATVEVEKVDAVRGANALLLFDIERDGAGGIRQARFAGIFIGGRRAVIGTLAKGGRPQPLAEAPVDIRPGRAYRLALTLAGTVAKLSVDGAPGVEADLGAPPQGSGGQGLLTLGSARFDNVVVTSGGKVVYEESFDSYADGAVPGQGEAPGDGSMAGGTGTGASAGAGKAGGEKGSGGDKGTMTGAGMTGASGGGSMSGAGAGAGSGAMGGGTMGGDGSMMGGTGMTSTPGQVSQEGGGYAGGPLPKTPGLDGALPAASFAIPEEDRRLIRRRYLDLLGRGPSEAEVLTAQKAGPAACVQALVRSSEFWRNWYEEELFFFLLIDQFRPTGEPLASLPDRLTRGETDPRTALAEIVVSQYFSARNPGNDTFVTVVMEQVLSLKVQEKANEKDLEGGKKMYDGYAASFLGEKGDSQSDVVKIAFQKRAMSERYVERLYRRTVGAEIPPEERARAAERFEKDPRALPAIVEGWVLSPLYASAAKYPRAKTDPQWIRTLYVDLLGARPDYREFRDTRNALLALADSTPIRRVLGKVVVDSKKADRAAQAGADGKRWIEERFLLLLGRAPRADELPVFEAALKEHGPRLVLRALVQSKEYQSY